MKHCAHCRVDISGDPQHCPLCNNDLQGASDGPGIFPEIPLVLQKNKQFLRIIAFAMVAAAVICVLINLLRPEKGWWSLFVVAGIVSFWLSVLFIVTKRGNLHKTITWLTALWSIVALLFDLATGFHRWSINFVIPITCTCAMISMTLLARILKLDMRDYTIYLVIDAIFGIVSLFLLLFGELTVRVPSIICVGASVLSLAGLFIFEGKAMLEELQRRMHI